MRSKLKQSNKNEKYIDLPPLRANKPYKLTPRYKSNAKSYPKIIPQYVSTKEDHSILYNYKKYEQQKTIANDRPKQHYKRKKKHGVVRLNFNKQKYSQSDQSDEANITSNFKKQIQNNLKLIKLQKQNKKKAISIQRYRNITQQNKNIQSSLQKDYQSYNIVTEQNVFTKINQIIINNQSKSSNLIDDLQKNITPLSILDHYKYNKEQMNNYKDNRNINTNKRYRTKMKTQISQQDHSRLIQHTKSRDCLKNNNNYHQWRKISIDLQDGSQLSYNQSSYQQQTDRLEKIRLKNDVSLKKYFQGKSYLKKLKNYRQSFVFKTNKIK